MSPESLAMYRSRMAVVWEPKSLFSVPYAESIQLGFHEFDARALDQLGLPSWAAPNIWLHPPTRRSYGLVCVGEDSEDREILYAEDSGRIFVNEAAGGRLSVASSVLDFLTLLLELAELIEKSIMLCGSEAYTDGRMPNDLLAEFWKEVEIRLGPEEAEKSIWHAEVARMSRNFS